MGCASTSILATRTFTLETHPSTVDAGKLSDFVSAGVNRLSFGIQSFDELVLRACGRGDTVDTVLPAVEAAMALPFRERKPGNLMYGLPEKSLEIVGERPESSRGTGCARLHALCPVYLPEFKNYVEAQNSYIPTGDDRNAMYDMAYAYLNERATISLTSVPGLSRRANSMPSAAMSHVHARLSALAPGHFRARAPTFTRTSFPGRSGRRR